ncbi:MAG: AAA family ATPase [Xenococcaceae cyanobacterium MO_207.B15]|nr:AAA family ATPase [Xenococcaceae cyanobacterium MO_207.B15]
MSFPIVITYKISYRFNDSEQKISLNGGLTTFVGANGCGKTQVLKKLKNLLSHHTNGRKVRYLSAGRLATLETYRSNTQGNNQQPDNRAGFGGRDVSRYRHQSETAFGDFHTLNERPDIQIKVTERLKSLFRRDLFVDWDSGSLKINFKSLDISGNTYSSAREASGLLHLVSILTALYDDEVGALLIDEPEVSLHPQLQAFLLREIQSVAGNPEDKKKKIVIIATHSTSMIDVKKPEDLTRIVFFTDLATPPSQVRVDAGELKNQKLKSLIARLGSTHKEAFFSSHPLLVEGQSDLIICNALDSRLNLYLGVAGTQIVPVIGKGTMPIVAKLMRLIGKQPIIITDLDGLTDDMDLINIFANDPKAHKLAEAKGHPNLSQFANSIKSVLSKTINNNWNDISNNAEQHSYWINRDKGQDENIAKRRSATAILLTSTEAQRRSWSNSSDWNSLYNRLIALLDCLEKAGCFILRKGTIENYYKFCNQNTSSGKPSAASDEVDKLVLETDEFIENHYSDLVTALRYAAEARIIDESSAISDLLLDFVPKIQRNLETKTSDDKLESLKFSSLREKASLFKIQNISKQKSEATIKVDLTTDILDVSGFPITFTKKSHAVEEVENKIKPK